MTDIATRIAERIRLRLAALVFARAITPREHAALAARVDRARNRAVIQMGGCS